jgi:hypothetical protein
MCLPRFGFVPFSMPTRSGVTPMLTPFWNNATADDLQALDLFLTWHRMKYQLLEPRTYYLYHLLQ